MAGSRGKLYGVGLGPGDPELMTLKAARLIAACPVVAHFRKRGRPGHARTIAASLLPKGIEEIACEYPVTTEIAFGDEAYVTALRDFYEASAAIIARPLAAGRLG